jgi:hypothetical protein
MIPMTQAIIDVNTMMVKFLDTFATDHTVEGTSRFDYFAIKAEVL